ncbi:hypothetical protein CMU89_17030 [Elizabethkingia anophelis]|nr:hypothetical protein [Elizabethkingia anophelis]MDV3544345.1 hypothetical protein [Elizabethkingia anophelis]
MALRIRKTGEILCAAHTKQEEGDTYLDDNIHYFLSVLTGAIIASENHFEDNLWYWNILPEQQEHYKEILKYGNPQGDPETKQ